MAPIVTRIKTDAKMDAADRQHPQDGRLAFEWQGRMIDVRCAALPVAPSGQKLTLRLLDRENLCAASMNYSCMRLRFRNACVNRFMVIPRMVA